MSIRQFANSPFRRRYTPSGETVKWPAFISAKLFWAGVKRDNNEYIGIFCAMNVMVDDYARDHSEEMDN